MPTAAGPRIDDRLIRLIEQRASKQTAAELTRLVGNAAWTFGLVRPSYQQVRVIRLRFASAPTFRASGVSTLAFVVDVAWNMPSTYELAYNYLAGRPAPNWRRANVPRRGS